METKQNENRTMNKISMFKKSASKAYAGLSKNYKQKLVYNLLAAIKSKDRNRFFEIMVHNLNGIMKTEEQKNLAMSLEKNYEELQGAYFDKYAYALVCGILASEDQKSNEEEEGDVNE